MYKIAKPKAHRRKFSTRKSLSSKRATYAHHNLLDLIERFKKDNRRNLIILKKFLEDQIQKTHVKKWVLEKDYSAFDTAWDGAFSLLLTLDSEKDSRAKRADLELLLEDLMKLKEFLLTPSAC